MKNKYRKELSKIKEEIKKLSKKKREQEEFLHYTEICLKREKKKRWTRIKYFFPLFSIREQKVLELRFLNLMTLEECSKCSGLARELIRQIESKALDKLYYD